MNPFQKNLNDNELIREATRLGISVDDLKAQQMAPSAVEMSPFDEMKMMKQAQMPSQSPEMNAIVREYLMKKLAKPAVVPDEATLQVPTQQKAPSLLDQFSSEKYQEALTKMKDQQSNIGLSQLASGIGDALARRDSSSSDKFYQDLQGNIKDQTVGEFGRQKAMAISDVKTKSDLAKMDPNSEESVNFRNLVQSTMPNIAKTYGDSFKLVTAADANNILDFGKMREQIEGRKDTVRIASMNRDTARDDKMTERNYKLATPFGLANTEQDAKDLKSGYESKKNFDMKVDQMIALREKHQGGAIMNREDVARGQQLSKDLLLEYKNMAKLGVLSVSDEKILNKIIPADPLEYNSMLAGMQRQDPILNNMKAFKKDSDNDFNTRIKTRVRDPKPYNDSNETKKDLGNDKEMNSKIESFMKKNGITDRNEAIQILKENGKI